MIFGAHIVIYSTDAEADRAFFRDVLGLTPIDAGHDWLIFSLPPTEAAIHPHDRNDVHELYFLCQDLKEEIAGLQKKNILCSEIQEARWGSITSIHLPGGGKIGLYQPRHPLAIPTPAN
jgi:catechol 2,3-dioxygenase-like lactoylglutathione lyase family enzyme